MVTFMNESNTCPQCNHEAEDHYTQYADPELPAICLHQFSDGSWCYCKVEK